MDTFQIRGGRMLMQRIGGLNPVRQRNGGPLFKETRPTLRRKNARAPEGYGLWAFPYPLFDPYFASFQVRLAQPKRLQALEVAVQGAHELEKDEREAIYDAWNEEYERWSEAPATKERMRVRKFWVSGTLYTHLGATGDAEWSEMSVTEFARVLRKQYARDLAQAKRPWFPGDKSTTSTIDRAPGHNHRAHRGPWPLSVDHLEVFLGRGTRIH